MSSTSSRSWSPITSTSERWSCALMPSTSATAPGSIPGSLRAASSTSHTPSRELSASPAATCSPRRVLPAPPAPTRLTKRCSPTNRRTSASAPSAAHETRHQMRQVVRQRRIVQLARGGVCGADRDAVDSERLDPEDQRRILGQDGRLQRPCLDARLHPKLVAEHPAQTLVGAEGVALAATAVQGQHQQPPPSLPQRLGGHGDLQVRHHRHLVPAIQAGLEEILLGGAAQLPQPGRLCHAHRGGS